MKTVSEDSEIPPACTGGRCCVGVDSVFSYGGWNSEDERTPVFYEDLYALDGKKMKWRKVREKSLLRSTSKPMGRKDCGMSMCGDSLVITAGYGLNDKRFGISPDYEWEEIQGGEGCDNGQFVFYIRRDMWREVRTRFRSKRPPPRSGHSQTTIDKSRIAVYGGSGKGGRKNDLWVLDMKTEEWTEVPRPLSVRLWPSARMHHTGLRLQLSATESLLLILWGSSHTRTVCTDGFLIDITTGECNQLAIYGEPLPVRLHTSCCFELRDGKFDIITFGGTSDSWSDRKRTPTSRLTTLRWDPNQRGILTAVPDRDGVTALKQQLAAERTQKEEMETKLRKQEREIVDLRIEKQRLKSRVEELEDEMEVQKNDSTGQQEQLDTVQQTVQRLEASIAELHQKQNYPVDIYGRKTSQLDSNDQTGSFLDQISRDSYVNNDQIDVVAKAVGCHWLRLGASLPKYTETEIRDIVSSLRQEDVKDSDKLRHILKTWRTRDGSKATLGQLREACEKVEIWGGVELALEDAFKMNWE